jgi:hypothetical protein
MDQNDHIELGRAQRNSEGATNEAEVEAHIEPLPASPDRSQGESDGGALEFGVQVQTAPSPSLERSQGHSEGGAVEFEIQVQTELAQSPERFRGGDSEHAVGEEAQVESSECSRGDCGATAVMVDSAVQTEPTEPSPPLPERPRGADLAVRTWSYE